MTLIERLEKAGEGSLADLIDRLTLYEHREGYDGKDWEKIASEAAEAIRALHADKAMLTGQLQASRAMLAASPSVGGWEDISTAPKDGTLVDLWASYGERVAGAKWTNGVWREWALDGFDSMGWVRLEGTATHWMPLPPPPVSTGSRPQEAVPTQQSEAAFVADLRYEVARDRAYRDGLRAGFRLGEAGDAETYEAVLGNIVSNILAAAKELNVAVSAQPADSCSSNEGAGGWIEWNGGENPVPGRIVEWRNRSGMESTVLSDSLSGWQWPHVVGPQNDIIAYRILPQTEKGS